MRVKNLILILIISLSFCGCYIGEPTYEVFERNMNINIGDSFIPNMNKDKREIYSDDRYIYRGRIGQCNYGFLTNRDNKPEKVIGWVIISGKEYCKKRQAWSMN